MPTAPAGAGLSPALIFWRVSVAGRIEWPVTALHPDRSLAYRSAMYYS
ncbi:hypothetical protein IJ21_35830 [Paenibacillus sp. 32O-W]|jgi:hypothetical protein|nr:hypothetical protein IJ21_35830 [Paenibacillus sp. 32O-W]